MDGPIHSSYFNRQQSNYKMHFFFTQSQLQENKPSSTGLTSTTYQNLTPSLDVFVYGLQIFPGSKPKFLWMIQIQISSFSSYWKLISSGMTLFLRNHTKVEMILKGNLDLIPFHQWKFKLLAGKFTWGVKAKHCWALSKFFVFKILLTTTQQCFTFTPFPPIIWIFTEGEGDGIESRLSF